MNKGLNLLIIVTTGVFLQSCVTYPLMQNTINMPLADQSHELSCSASYGGYGPGILASYTIDSNIVAMADFTGNFSKYVYNSADGFITDSIKLSNVYGEIAAGYYRKILLPRNKILRFEALGGLGYGSFSTRESSFNHDHGGEPLVYQNINGTDINAFLQADLIKATRHFDYGLGIQFKDAHFNESVHSYQIDFPGSVYNATLKGDLYLLQPAFIANIHFNRFAIRFSTGFTYLINYRKFWEYELMNDPTSLYCCIGVNVKLFGKY